VVELAKFPGTALYADRSRHPDTAAAPGVVVIRCESALLYFNVEYVRERVFEILSARAEPVRLVVFALGTVPKVDLAGAELLLELLRTFRTRSVEFRVADTRGEVREALHRIGFDLEHGPLETGQTVDAVVARWRSPGA
jgi:MFS superfamily sulfate permease-like transporter